MGEHENAAGFEPFRNLRFGARDPVEGAQPLEMRGLYVGDDRRAGPGERREGAQLTGVVEAHLHRRGAVLRAQAEQSKRHADVVVEVALRLEHGAQRGERGGQQLLGRRLAVGSGDRGHRKLEPHAMGGRESLQREQGVGHHEEVRDPPAAPRSPPRSGDHRTRSAASEDVLNEVVAVESLSGQRDEERPRHVGARIGHDAASPGLAYRRSPDGAGNEGAVKRLGVCHQHETQSRRGAARPPRGRRRGASRPR